MSKLRLTSNALSIDKRIIGFFPFLAWFQQLNRRSIVADLMAGLTGAIIVIPQGIAYALIAGLPPEYGLYTAIITPVVAGLFGSSLHLISGPTAAISIVVMSVVSNVVPPESSSYIPAVLTLTLLAGLIQLGLGLARLGALVNFISHTVVIGFTAGAAFLIATSQFKYVLSVSVPPGASFVESLSALASQIGATNPYAVAIATITILTTVLAKKINPKSPSMMIGMIAGTLFCWLFDGTAKGVALVGALSGQLPVFSLTSISGNEILELVPGAIAVATLGLVEAVSIARAISIRSGQRIDGNQEFIGQGLSNVVGSLFSCYAGSGSFTRTGVNYDSGAQSPLAAIFAAAVLVLVLMVAPEITALLPLPAMAGSILLVSWGLIDKHHIAQISRSNAEERATLLVTFAATLLVELEFAIYSGICLSLILYLKKTSKPRITEVAPKIGETGTKEFRGAERLGLDSCPQIKILRVDGSIFFGATDHIRSQLEWHARHMTGKSELLLHCGGVNFIDLSGAEMLAQQVERMAKKGINLCFCAMKNTVLEELAEAGYLDQLGKKRFYGNENEALDVLINRQFRPEICNVCASRVFRQCPPFRH